MTPELAERLFDYNRETGQLTWKVTHGRARVGQTAGTTTGTHIAVAYNRVSYPITTIIWLIVFRRKPAEGLRVDHKNRNPQDNRLLNLREISHAENMQNRGAQVNNKLGLKGVCYHKASGKYMAYISIDGKRKHLGLFVQADKAYEAYCKAAVKYHSCPPEEVTNHLTKKANT
jgi:hypothetical protein